MKQDLVIYIHGVSPDLDLVTNTPEFFVTGKRPGKPKGHAGQYAAFHRGVSRHLKGAERRARWQDAVICGTEWGWESFESDAWIGKSHRLIDAEFWLGRRVLKVMRRRGPWGRLLEKMRQTALYGGADVFYYLSADGRESIRWRISEQIAAALEAAPGEIDELSCTLVGHSAGSVIALDIVTDLRAGRHFVGDPKALEERERSLERQRAGLGHEDAQTKIKSAFGDSLKAVRRLRQLLARVDQKRLKLERLITLGSPITLLALRSDEAVDALAYRHPMRPSLLGFGGGDEKTGTEAAPEWINIWDIRDPVSFPVEPLIRDPDAVEPPPFDETAAVKDVHVATSARFWRSHTEYWTSRAVHRAVAAQL